MKNYLIKFDILSQFVYVLYQMPNFFNIIFGSNKGLILKIFAISDKNALIFSQIEKMTQKIN